MSTANKNSLYLITASLLMMVGVFAKPLNIPDPWDFLPMFAAMICFYLFFRGNRKIKQERAASSVPPPPPAPIAARKKVFWAVAIALIAGSVSFLPLMPYTVGNFQPWLYYYVVPAQVLFLVVFLTYYRKKLMGSIEPSKK